MPTIYNPSNAQQQAQYNRVVVGAELDANQQDGSLWASGLTAQELAYTIARKWQDRDKWFMAGFLENMPGRSFSVASQEHGWYEMGNTRRGVALQEPTGGFVLNAANLVAETANASQYYQVNDVLNFPKKGAFQAKVVAVDMTGPGATEKLTLAKIDGTNWIAGDVADNDFVGYAFNAYPEKSGQPNGRTYRPEYYSNKLTITKATTEYSGDALTQRIQIFPESYVKFNEHETVKEFCINKENVLMWSQESPAGANSLQSRGMVHDILDNSQVETQYTGAAVEADLQTTIRNLSSLNPSYEYMLLAGSELYYDTTAALKEYVVDGGVLYGSVGDIQQELAVGYKIGQYQFGTHTISLKHYRGFDDTNVTGTTAASATDIDFKSFGLFLNMMMQGGVTDGGNGPGSGNSIPYVSYAYKSMGGVDRSMVVGFLQGMTGLNNNAGFGSALTDIQQMANMDQSVAQMVSSDLDCDRMFMLGQVGSRLVAVDTGHASIRKIG